MIPRLLKCLFSTFEWFVISFLKSHKSDLILGHRGKKKWFQHVRPHKSIDNRLLKYTLVLFLLFPCMNILKTCHCHDFLILLITSPLLVYTGYLSVLNLYVSTLTNTYNVFLRCLVSLRNCIPFLKDIIQFAFSVLTSLWISVVFSNHFPNKHHRTTPNRSEHCSCSCTTVNTEFERLWMTEFEWRSRKMLLLH